MRGAQSLEGVLGFPGRVLPTLALLGWGADAAKGTSPQHSPALERLGHVLLDVSSCVREPVGLTHVCTCCKWEHRAPPELLWELGVGAEEEPGKIPFPLVCVLFPVGGPLSHPTGLERAEPQAGE